VNETGISNQQGYSAFSHMMRHAMLSFKKEDRSAMMPDVKPNSLLLLYCSSGLEATNVPNKDMQ
jgi:hypothetical protein